MQKRNSLLIKRLKISIYGHIILICFASFIQLVLEPQFYFKSYSVALCFCGAGLAPILAVIVESVRKHPINYKSAIGSFISLILIIVLTVYCFMRIKNQYTTILLTFDYIIVLLPLLNILVLAFTLFWLLKDKSN